MAQPTLRTLWTITRAAKFTPFSLDSDRLVNLLQVVKMLLTDERRATLASEPLQVQEVLQGLSKLRPPSQDSRDALNAWSQKLLEPPKPKVWPNALGFDKGCCTCIVCLDTGYLDMGDPQTWIIHVHWSSPSGCASVLLERAQATADRAMCQHAWAKALSTTIRDTPHLMTQTPPSCARRIYTSSFTFRCSQYRNSSPPKICSLTAHTGRSLHNQKRNRQQACKLLTRAGVAGGGR